MRIYKVKVHPSADEDIAELTDFLFEKMSREGGNRYLDAMGEEMRSLALFADCFAESRSKTVRNIHPRARRMVSHNHKWCYVFHIEGDTVVIDRVLKSTMITQ